MLIVYLLRKDTLPAGNRLLVMGSQEEWTFEQRGAFLATSSKYGELWGTPSVNDD